jgi:hypothetical protein
VIKKHLIPVSFVLSGLALPVGVALAKGDADRFGRFADGARASGTLQMTLTYSGDPETCAAAKVCGVSGRVVTKLRLSTSKRVRVSGGDVAVLRVTGSANATVRDTVAGHVCHGSGRVNATGVGFKGDSKGVLLRVGVLAGDDDPFDTDCRAPTLESLGETALPAVRLRKVAVGIGTLRLRVDATRRVLGDGYRGSLKIAGTISLHD